MSDTLTNKEVDELVKLGKDIQAGLSCDANGTGEPCRTDRLDAISNMIRYLEILEYDVIAPGKYKEDEQKGRTLGPDNPEGA